MQPSLDDFAGKARLGERADFPSLSGEQMRQFLYLMPVIGGKHNLHSAFSCPSFSNIARTKSAPEKG